MSVRLDPRPKRKAGSKGQLAAAANGQVQGGKASAAKARARRVPINLPAISIQKRGE